MSQVADAENGELHPGFQLGPSASRILITSKLFPLQIVDFINTCLQHHTYFLLSKQLLSKEEISAGIFI